MRNNETGEFELVVGNRQLLSGFFIVVLLFAVAFAMGYVVGENSRTAKGAQPASPVAANTADVRPQPASPAAAPADNSAAAKPAGSGTEPATESPAEPATQPAREVEPPASAPAPQRAAPPRGEDPAPGAYWQVVATANQESAIQLSQSLKDKGFPAFTSPGPNNLTRVLVGPYVDTASMGRAKTELEGAGFSHLGTFKK
jgi:cell division septation protein DedD